MKTAAKVFIWIGMIGGALMIFPLVIGILALQKLNEAKTSAELSGWGIATLLCCSTLGGIFMLCLKDEDLTENTQTQRPVNTTPVNAEQPKLNSTSINTTIEQELSRAKNLYEKGILSEEEYKEIRTSILAKYL